MLAFPLALGITDPPVIALTCLALALLTRPGPARPGLAAAPRPARPGLWAAALVLGTACAMKYTAWPALAVLAAMLAARDGVRAAARLTGRHPGHRRCPGRSPRAAGFRPAPRR